MSLADFELHLHIPRYSDPSFPNLTIHHLKGKTLYSILKTVVLSYKRISVYYKQICNDTYVIKGTLQVLDSFFLQVLDLIKLYYT
jgi:hypothetical protein